MINQQFIIKYVFLLIIGILINLQFFTAYIFCQFSGTGKSYVGTILAKLLIPKQKKPLVVICYTNHALDHFLESLIGFTDKIIRIGSRSKNSKLDKYNLSGLKRSLLETGSRDKRIYKAVTALNQHLKLGKSEIKIFSV